MSKTKAAPAPLTRKQLSRAQREKRMRQYIIYGTVVVAVIVAGLIGYGLFDQLVLLPRRPVARVNDAAIRLGDFQKAVRYQRFLVITQQYQQLLQLREILGTDAQSLQYYDSQLQQLVSYLSDSESLGRQVLNTLIDDQLIRQEAAKRGIMVSREEVDARLQETFGYFPNGTPTPTITPSPFPTDVPPTVDLTQAARLTPTPTLTPTATFTPTATATAGPSPTPTATETPGPTATPYTAAAYATRVFSYTSDLREFADLSEADFRYFLETEILREKLTQAIGADVSNVQEQVRARHILIRVSQTATETVKAEAKTQIDEVLARLKAGEDWTALAAQYSQDPSNAQEGGDLGWFKQGDMVSEFEQVAFNTPVGEISEPVLTQFGWHIIQGLGRDMRPLTDSELEQARQKAFDDWLQTQRAASDANDKPVVETLDTWIGHVPTTPVIPGLGQ
ncbi:MAG TPA: peptidylprolyl isomerase [Anaerolineales bacterium]|nr:peptidylprolyl isomerase [Anaerolineales bacterium]